jgi:hypothetical protein
MSLRAFVRSARTVSGNKGAGSGRLPRGGAALALVTGLIRVIRVIRVYSGLKVPKCFRICYNEWRGRQTERIHSVQTDTVNSFRKRGRNITGGKEMALRSVCYSGNQNKIVLSFSICAATIRPCHSMPFAMWNSDLDQHQTESQFVYVHLGLVHVLILNIVSLDLPLPTSRNASCQL